MCITTLVNFANVEHELNQYRDAVLDIQAHIDMDVKYLSAAKQSTLLLTRPDALGQHVLLGCAPTLTSNHEEGYKGGERVLYYTKPLHVNLIHMNMIKP